MKKVVLAGLLNEQNLGDIVIADCAKFLFKKLSSETEVEFVGLNLNGLIEKKQSKPFIVRKFAGATRRINRRFNKRYFFKEISSHKKYYMSAVKDADLVVVVGGGMIKYKYQKFWIFLSALSSVCNDLAVPVVFNALGVEGFDANDYRCSVLKDALNLPCVKVITTRDDIFTLKEKYLADNDRVIAKMVADPAVFASDVYGVKKNLVSDVVGIGIVRGDIFKDNGVNVSRSELIELYSGIIKELEARNQKWKIFTNGLPIDIEILNEILVRVNRERAGCVVIPKTAKELLEIISEFKGVIASRLHACIISYSLDVPAVGLVWNNKLTLFGKNIGHEDRFIRPSDFESKKIVDLLYSAIEEGYISDRNMQFNNSIIKSIDEILFINKIK